MLYDEEGNVYVERPIIPKEQNLMYIVKDYRRMYSEYDKMLAHIKNLGETNTKVAHYNYFLVRKNQEQREVIKYCLRLMENSGIKPTPYLNNYVKDNKL